MTLNPQAEADILIAISGMTDWQHGDDLCDCVYQRIGSWDNPYLGVRHEIRLCCAWDKLRAMFPDCFRDLVTGQPQQWNGAVEMPRYLWYRQLAIQQGRSLPEIRSEYEHEKPPKGVRRQKRKRWWQW